MAERTLCSGYIWGELMQMILTMVAWGCLMGWLAAWIITGVWLWGPLWAVIGCLSVAVLLTAYQRHRAELARWVKHLLYSVSGRN